MRLLFVLENLAERCGANVNIAMVFAKQMACSFEIHALARYDDTRPISEEHKKNFSHVHLFYGNQAGELTRFTSGEWKNAHSFVSKGKLVLRNPKMLAFMIDAKYLDYSISRRKCKKAIEKVCRDSEYDAVIAVSAPYYIMHAVSEAKIPCKKMSIQLDPYTNNYTLPNFLKVRRMIIEDRVIRKMNTLFVADCVYNEMVLEKKYDLENMISFPLPGIIVSKIKARKEVGVPCDQKNTVDFVFVGQFYEKIRNPKYLCDLFLELPPNYILHIVGGGCEQLLKKYKEILQDRLILHGWVSKKEADQYISQYDALVNVNNTITNQMPSKLFEYIGTGKPILNICKSDRCLSIPYIENYKNGISVVESEKMIFANVESVIKFISSNSNYSMNMEDIIARFWNNTDIFVAELLIKEIEKEVRGRKC